MTELIIIKTGNSKEIRKTLEAKHINYEVYQEETQQNWEFQERQALQEWNKLSDEKLIAEWENLSDNGEN
jgi:hypothetical protein